MIGALIGDCIGSFWERSGNKSPHIPLWVPACHFTDDSVTTAAVARWLRDGTGDEPSLIPIMRQYCKTYRDVGFAKRMQEWIDSDTPQAYGSWGNGSAMRVSPVALYARNHPEMMDLAKQSANITHNHPEAVRGAQAIAYAISYALERGSDGLLEAVEREFGYCDLLTIDPDEVRPHHIFDVSCKGTVPLALAIAVRSGSFDHAMIWCCSMGGDADTLAAIAGPICEMLYGIPEQHVLNARVRFQDTPLWDDVMAIYNIDRVQQRLKDNGYRFDALPATGERVGRKSFHVI